MSRFQMQNTIPYGSYILCENSNLCIKDRIGCLCPSLLSHLQNNLTGRSFTVHNALWDLVNFHHMTGHPGLPQSSHHVISCEQDITPDTWGSNLGSQGVSVSGPKVDG